MEAPSYSQASRAASFPQIVGALPPLFVAFTTMPS